ncbi:uncharacterized protein L969DRAFT_44369 [Mixia osmundae IAM 14324]|uniref:Ribonuclease P/MRP protein subunit POP5 n=1 Tax=Mixia osmundae (strain CBS 9802 / IAM 14324 / JCM 22182 / KY 12970) TaxID=764103 RepID=G7DT20_MIXOS|nr:uncharacterized protein L969DRAFT_44369 [Mixia osmundae IAM 14324]KEI42767.1 hypothetical protein L969DRAFT_44369 [Mixia osmundae IAM 14324]GAA93899.1 hypothetical protein E5Q_00545 [Mixia osmundae IAM 14324]
MRFKNRYLLAEFIFAPDSDAPSFSESDIVRLVRDALSVNFGDAGWAEAGSSLNVKYLSPTTHIMILRTPRSACQLVWTALTLTRQLKGVDCIIRVMHVGGTIRKSQQAAIKYDRDLILRRATQALQSSANDEETRTLLLQSEQLINAIAE